jgi:acetolactate synthase-1/3 small subunit
MRHTLSITVQDRPGVLSRVAGLFTRRGYNIESIAVGPTEEPGMSKMIIVVSGDDRSIESITKNVHKLVEVIKVTDLSQESMMERELALIKVTANANTRSEILQITNIFRARIIDVSENSVVVEVTGDEGKIDAMVNLFRPFGIKEMVRTGRIAMVRGQQKSGSEKPRVIA